MGDHVFVSYAREDTAYAERLVSHLRDHGIAVWIDSALRFGVGWPEAIASHIDRCVAFVVLMSPAAAASPWVRREILRAQDQRKPIFPLLLAGVPLFTVSDLQYEQIPGESMPSPRWIEAIATAVHPDRGHSVGSSTAPNLSAFAAPPPSRAPRHVWVSAGHTGSILSVAFSPDGCLLAAASGEKVRLWSLA